MSSTPTSNEPSPLPGRAAGLNRRFILSLLVLGIVMVAVGVRFLRPEEQTFAGEVALLDGTNVRIAAVTYGTNHIYGPPLARWTAGLPSPAQAVVKRFFGRHASAISSLGFAEPQLVIWLHRWTNSGAIATNRSIYFNAFLADESGFVSGSRAYLAAGGSAVGQVSFKAVPRRDPTISVGFITWLEGGRWTNCGSLSFRNPLFGKHPRWTPEATPVTKRLGGIEATLIQLSTGHGEEVSHKTTRGGGAVVTFSTNRNNGRNSTVAHLSVQSLVATNEAWQVASLQLSDTTGNSVRSTSVSWGGSEPYVQFQPSLWPGEPWKLKCELKRTAGFKPEELFTFRDVPLGVPETTNYLGWTTNVADLSVTLDRVIHRRALTNNSWSSSELSGLSFTHSALPTNVHLDFVGIVFDSGGTVENGGSRSDDTMRTYSFSRFPAGARRADITLAIQQSRWIEFTVEPEVGTARIEIPPRK